MKTLLDSKVHFDLGVGLLIFFFTVVAAGRVRVAWPGLFLSFETEGIRGATAVRKAGASPPGIITAGKMNVRSGPASARRHAEE